MASKFNDKTEYIQGYKKFDEVDNHKNFDVIGSSTDDTLVLHSLHKDNHYDRDNIDIDYYGGGGTDTLDYTGGTKSVEVTVADQGTSSQAGFELYINGGRGTDHADLNLDSLEVLTHSVEVLKLTSDGDTVDLSGLSPYVDVVINGNGGNDTMRGSWIADFFYGDDDDDVLVGKDGDDYLNGGDGDDFLNGGDGDDTLVTGDGADIVMGGEGRDIIYAAADLNSDGVNTIYGDHFGNAITGYAPIAGHFNEQDIFVIGYDTEVTHDNSDDDSNGLFNEETLSVGGDVLGKLGGAAIKAAGYGSLASAAVSVGFTIGGTVLGNLISKGSDASTGNITEDNTDNQVLIKDFDAWADTTIIALDEHADLVTASVETSPTGGSTGTFDIGGTEFLQIELATSQLSIMENENSDLSSIADEKAAILDNLMLNSIVVWSGDDHLSGGGTGVYATTMNGTNIVFDQDEQSVLEGYLSAGNSDGVWIIGDYGSSVIYGHSLNAVAGSNSDNIMYSGSYKSTTSSAWFSSETISMYGGGGDDVLFGSSAGEDMLFGGEGNDYLHGLRGGTDELNGGEGFDIASFARITDEDGDILNLDWTANDGYTKVGVYANLAESDSNGRVTAKFITSEHAADYRDTGTVSNDWATAAYLSEIEGLEGSDYDDILIGHDEDESYLIGNGGADILISGAGNDTIIGGDGQDTMTGGAGADIFVFNGPDVDGTTVWWEWITDFDATEDIIQLNGTKDTSFDELNIFYMSGSDVTIINYGDGSIRLTGYMTNELTVDDFVFG